MTLKTLRKQNKLTQAQCAKYLGIPLRTYQNYENDERKADTFKYKSMINALMQYNNIDEEHGILSLEKIKEITSEVFSDYSVEYCYIFGSYAKGKATETSDIDFLVSAPVSGIRFFDLAENLREKLNKKVDLLNKQQLNNNPELINEILKDGIKIYG